MLSSLGEFQKGSYFDFQRGSMVIWECSCAPRTNAYFSAINSLENIGVELRIRSPRMARMDRVWNKLT